MALKRKDQLQIFCLSTVVEEAVIADLPKTMRKDMHEEAPDKFHKGKGDLTPWVSRFLAARRKSDLGVCHGKDPAVGDSDLMGVAPKILDGIAKTVKGLFDIRAPVFPIEAVLEGLPLERIFQLGTG